MRTHNSHQVTRTLKVTEMVCTECDNIIAEALSALNGVTHVQSDWRNNTVTVTYDLFRVKVQDVEKMFYEIGYPPDSGFFQRKKRDWLHFTEKNELDNLKYVGHCCSKPPATT
jgi:copper chaperone CopZ